MRVAFIKIGYARQWRIVFNTIQTDIRVSNTCELPREWRLRHVLLWTITKYIRLNRATTRRCSGSVRLIHNRGTGKEITPGRHRLFSAVCQVNRAPETRVRFFSFIHKEPGPENLSNSPTNWRCPCQRLPDNPMRKEWNEIWSLFDIQSKRGSGCQIKETHTVALCQDD